MVDKIKAITKNDFFSGCRLTRENTDGRLMAINDSYLAMAWENIGKINLVYSNNPSNLDLNNNLFNTNNSYILDMEFSPFNNKILSFSNISGDVTFSKIKEYNEVTLDAFNYHNNKISFINFNPVVSNVICCITSSGEIFILDTIKFSPLLEVQTSKTPNSIFWSPNGSLIGYIGNKILSIIDPREDTIFMEHKLSNYISKPKLAWLNNDSLVVTNSKNQNKFLNIFDIRKIEQNPYSSIEIGSNSYSDVITPFVNPELKLIYTTKKNDNAITIFDYSNGSLQKIKEFKSSEDNIFSLQLNRKYLDKNELEMDRFIRYTINNKIYYISFFLNEEKKDSNESYYPKEDLNKSKMTPEEWFEEPQNIQNQENNIYINNPKNEVKEKELLKEIEFLKKKVKELEKQNQDFNNKLESEKNLIEELNSKKKIISDLEGEKNRKEKEYNEKLLNQKNNITELEKEISNTKSEVSNKNELYENLQNYSKDLEKKYNEELKKNENLMEENKKYKTDIENYEKIKKENNEEVKENININQEKEQLSLQITKLNEKLQKNEQTIQSLQNEIKNLKNEKGQKDLLEKKGSENLNNNLEKEKEKNKELDGVSGFIVIKKVEKNGISQFEEESFGDTNENNIINDYNQKIASLTEEIENLQKELNDNKKQLEDKDQILNNMKNQISENENKKNEEYKKLSEIIENLKNESAKLKSSNEQNITKIKEKDEQLKEEKNNK